MLPGIASNESPADCRFDDVQQALDKVNVVKLSARLMLDIIWSYLLPFVLVVAVWQNKSWRPRARSSSRSGSGSVVVAVPVPVPVAMAVAVVRVVVVVGCGSGNGSA